MADDRRPGELRTVAIPEDDNWLEQLVSSVQRIELGLDATYTAVVALDQRARRRDPAPLDRGDIDAIRLLRERYTLACNADLQTVTIPRGLAFALLLIVDAQAGGPA